MEGEGDEYAAAGHLGFPEEYHDVRAFCDEPSDGSAWPPHVGEPTTSKPEGEPWVAALKRDPQLDAARIVLDEASAHTLADQTFGGYPMPQTPGQI